MQDVNDDMDLFRRAAENYPLNTGSADFNEVLKKLPAEQSEKTNTPTAKKRNHKRLLLLLLLIPIGWILNNYSFNISEKRSGKRGENNKTEISKSFSPEISIPDTTTTVKPVLVTTNKPSLKNANNFQRNFNYNQEKKLKSISVTSKNNIQIIQNELSVIVVENTDQLAGKKENKSLPSTVNNNNNEINDIINSDEKLPLLIILNDDKKEVNKYDTTISNHEAINKLNKKTQRQKEYGLYAGIIITPDISTVKFQSVKNIGLSFGLLVGYQFNKKISMESGISWNKKFYYSDGRYFNTKKVYVPEHAQIKDVEGLCKMIELPVTVKYNFKQSGKTNLSTSAGLSSYFMKSEIYDYTIEKYGQQYPYHSAYKRASTNLLAVINVSVGYNRTLGKVGTLRIEPYLKIPLSGIGIGRLPITSTGLNMGITKNLF